MYAPTTITKAETFIWYAASPKLRLGVAYLHKQEAFRVLAAYQFVPETMTRPSLNGSVGVQGIGTGNPGYSLTMEKNLPVEIGNVNGFVGIGFRSNEDHLHPVAGMKIEAKNGIAFGFQWDGHAHHPFGIYNKGDMLYGVYLIGGVRMGLIVGTRF